MKQRLRDIVVMPINNGFYKKLYAWLNDFALMSDEDIQIDEEFIDLLDTLCKKFFNQPPSREVWQELIDMMILLCRVRRPRLRLKYPRPDQVQAKIDKAKEVDAEIEVKKKKPKM